MKIRVLWQIGDRALGFNAIPHNIKRLNTRDAGIWPNESGKNLDRSRLACAVRTDQHCDLAGRGKDRHVAQNFLTSVKLSQMLDRDHCLEILLLSCCARTLQNCEVSDARSSMIFTPGKAARW